MSTPLHSPQAEDTPQTIKLAHLLDYISRFEGRKQVKIEDSLVFSFTDTTVTLSANIDESMEKRIASAVEKARVEERHQVIIQLNRYVQQHGYRSEGFYVVDIDPLITGLTPPKESL